MRDKKTLPILPLRDIVVFPKMVAPLFVGRTKSVRALEEVDSENGEIMLVAQRDATTDDPAAADLHEVGTIANILQLLKLPDGTVKVLVEGVSRARVLDLVDRQDFYAGEVEVQDENDGDPDEAAALMRTVVEQFESYVKLFIQEQDQIRESQVTDHCGRAEEKLRQVKKAT